MEGKTRFATQVFIFQENIVAINSTNPTGKIYNFQICDTSIYESTPFNIRLDIDSDCGSPDVRVVIWGTAFDHTGESWILDNGNNVGGDVYVEGLPYLNSVTNQLVLRGEHGEVFPHGIYVWVSAPRQNVGKYLPVIRVSIFPASPLLGWQSMPTVDAQNPWVQDPIGPYLACYHCGAPGIPYSAMFPIWNVRQLVLVSPASTLKFEGGDIDYTGPNPEFAPFRIALPVCPPRGQLSWVTKTVVQGLGSKDFVDLFLCLPSKVVGSHLGASGYGCKNGTSLAYTQTGNLLAELTVANQTLLFVTVASMAAYVPPNVTSSFIISSTAMPSTGTELNWDRTAFAESDGGWELFNYDDGAGFGPADY